MKLLIAETSEDVSICVLQKCDPLGEELEKKSISSGYNFEEKLSFCASQGGAVLDWPESRQSEKGNTFE